MMKYALPFGDQIISVEEQKAVVRAHRRDTSCELSPSVSGNSGAGGAFFLHCTSSLSVQLW